MSAIELLFLLLNSFPMVVFTNPIEDMVLKKLLEKWEKYYYGRGVKENLKKAHKWFVECTNNGVVFDQVLLDEITKKMIRKSFDKKIINYYHSMRLSDFKDPKSGYELGKYYFYERQIGYSLYYYDMAAKLGCLRSQIALFKYYDENKRFLEADKYNQMTINNKKEELDPEAKAMKYRNNLKAGIQNHCKQCCLAQKTGVYYHYYEENWFTIYYEFNKGIDFSAY